MAKEEKKKSSSYQQRQFHRSNRDVTYYPGQFSTPWGVSFDEKNQQLVTSDQDHHYLQFLDHKDLKHIRSVGSEGDKPGQFNYPRGLSRQPNTNNLLVVDCDNHRVQVMNQEDKVVDIIGSKNGKKSSLDGGFNKPVGVACAPDGNFFVADTSNHRVQLFDASSRFVGKFGAEGSYYDFYRPFDVSMLDSRFAPSSAASSLLLVADHSNDRLSVRSSDGSQHILSRQLKYPYPRGVCVDLNGFVYVSSYVDTIEVLDPRSNFACLQEIGSRDDYEDGLFDTPSSLCVDHTNTLIVADLGHYCIQFFV